MRELSRDSETDDALIEVGRPVARHRRWHDQRETNAVPATKTIDAAAATAIWGPEPPLVADSNASTPRVLAATGHVGRRFDPSITVAPMAVAIEAA